MRELGSAQRDESFTEPVRNQVEPINAGPADHPCPFRGKRSLLIGFLGTGSQQLLQRAAGQPLTLLGSPVGGELDSLVGQPAAKIDATVGRVQHPFGRDAAVGVEHPVRVGQPDTAAGEEVRDFG
jgi:hypothetical protein